MIMNVKPIGEPYSEVKPFPEMLSVVTDPNLEVFQVTTDLTQTGISRSGFFSPDGSRFVFKRGPADSHESLYWCLCEIDHGYQLRNVTRPEDHPCAPFLVRGVGSGTAFPGRVGGGAGHGSEAPCHDYLYYFQDFSHEPNPRIKLCRVSLDDFRTETVTVFDSPVAGIGRRPRAGGKVARRGMTQGASLRSDGRKVIAAFNFVGDDNEDHFAPVIIDLQTLGIHGFEWEPYSWRVCGTYFQGDDPAHRDHIGMARVWRSQVWDPNDN